jgi:hypothetical protein
VEELSEYSDMLGLQRQSMSIVVSTPSLYYPLYSHVVDFVSNGKVNVIQSLLTSKSFNISSLL